MAPTKYMLKVSFFVDKIQHYFVKVYFVMDADAYVRDKYAI